MLRKRIFTVLAMLLIAAVLAASVAGCTFIRENEYRAANEAYATVSHNGYTLEITYNEFIDYFNSVGYYYVNSYGYSVEDALDLCISSKIQQKYLLTEAMVYLSDPDSVGQERVAALSHLPVKTPSDALTPAEYYAAVYAVSNSMITSAEDIAEESRQTEYTRIMNAVSSRDVSGIDFSDETKDYFETFFHAGAGCYVGQQLDLERVKIVVKYDDGKVSDPFVVPTAQYTTAFTSEATSDYSERTEEKEFVISFDESVTGSDGEETTEKHTLTYDYDLIYPRETKAEPEEETDYTTVTIGDFDPVSRYAKDSEIPDEIKQACKTISPIEEMEAAEKKGDSYMADAWRRVNENLNSANKMLTDLYASQFESAVLSALQAELYNQADRAFAATDAAVAAEYKYLYATAKDSYTGAADDDKAAFIEAVGEGTDSLYYYPAIDDIGNYYYVYQILFSFTDEQAAFLEDELGDDEEAIEEFTQRFFRSLKTQPSDPGYDAENYDPEDAEAKEPFGEEELVSDVIGKLESVLGKIYAGQALTEAEDGYDYAAEQLDTPEKRSAAAIDVFLDYLYRYNDDPGIFNNALRLSDDRRSRGFGLGGRVQRAGRRRVQGRERGTRFRHGSGRQRLRRRRQAGVESFELRHPSDDGLRHSVQGSYRRACSARQRRRDRRVSERQDQPRHRRKHVRRHNGRTQEREPHHGLQRFHLRGAHRSVHQGQEKQACAQRFRQGLAEYQRQEDQKRDIQGLSRLDKNHIRRKGDYNNEHC